MWRALWLVLLWGCAAGTHPATLTWSAVDDCLDHSAHTSVPLELHGYRVWADGVAVLETQANTAEVEPGACFVVTAFGRCAGDSAVRESRPSNQLCIAQPEPEPPALVRPGRVAQLSLHAVGEAHHHPPQEPEVPTPTAVTSHTPFPQDTLSVAHPSGIESDDLLLYFGTSFNSSGTFTTPSGLSSVWADAGAGFNQSSQLWEKEAAGTESAGTQAFVFATDGTLDFIAMRIPGGGTIEDFEPGEQDFTGAPSSPAVTAAGPGRLVISFLASSQNLDGSGNAPTAPSGMTMIEFGSGDNPGGVAAAYIVLESSGSAGPFVWDAPSTWNTAVTVLIELPAAPAGDYTPALVEGEAQGVGAALIAALGQQVALESGRAHGQGASLAQVTGYATEPSAGAGAATGAALLPAFGYAPPSESGQGAGVGSALSISQGVSFALAPGAGVGAGVELALVAGTEITYTPTLSPGQGRAQGTELQPALGYSLELHAGQGQGWGTQLLLIAGDQIPYQETLNPGLAHAAGVDLTLLAGSAPALNPGLGIGGGVNLNLFTGLVLGPVRQPSTRDLSTRYGTADRSTRYSTRAEQ